jgi:hypothetical protein
MCPAIDNPASCEIRVVIRFLRAKKKKKQKKNMNAAGIHRELCAATYGQNVMSKGTVGQWYRMFKDGRTNVHDEERSALPSVLSYDRVQSVDQKICER